MLSGWEKIVLLMGVGTILLGFLANGFMVLVNSINWMKSKRLGTGDFILLCLAISRIALLCSVTWSTFELVFSPDMLLPDEMNVSTVLWIVTQFASVWFATCLSVFYFLKISNFSHPVFLWLKWRTSQVIRTLMLGPLLFSLILEVPLLQRSYTYIIRKQNKTKSFQENEVSEDEYIFNMVFFNLMVLIPFTLCLLSFFFIILSLWRHTQRMERNATGSRDPNTEAHVRAMKAMFSFFILFLLFYTTILITQFISLSQNEMLGVFLGIPIMSFYPSVHSIFLILYNSKLRQEALKMWRQVRCSAPPPKGNEINLLPLMTP